MSKAESLQTIAKEVTDCTKCPLWKKRIKAVPGVGSPESRVVFIGEAPGQSEDVKGEPFVGAAGQLLDELLTTAGLSRAGVFITNVVKCRPPRNREPKRSEIATCTPYLNRQIELIQPEIIVTLGTHSTACVFSKANLRFTNITELHGRPYEATISSMRLTIFPMFHPAAALYYPKYRDQLKADFQVLKNELARERIAGR